MKKTRTIKKIIHSKPTIEGAGVHLNRVFGFHETHLFDPFLLLDDFRSENPDLYLAGFPWHPHRGIETITYVLDGTVEHGDSMGNKGVISAGDTQWMTAGSGIVHQEMPQGDPAGRMGGFQLWANLPRTHKMMDPRYRDIKRDQVPEVTLPDGVLVRIICAPASMYSRCTSATTAGLVRFSSSKHWSKLIPRACSMVPIAPSATSVPFCSRSNNFDFVIGALISSIALPGIHRSNNTSHPCGGR